MSVRNLRRFDTFDVHVHHSHTLFSVAASTTEGDQAPIVVLSYDQNIPNEISTDELQLTTTPTQTVWDFGSVTNPPNNTNSELGLIVTAAVAPNATNQLPVRFTLFAVLDNVSTVPAVFDYVISDPELSLQESAQVCDYSAKRLILLHIYNILLCYLRIPGYVYMKYDQLS